MHVAQGERKVQVHVTLLFHVGETLNLENYVSKSFTNKSSKHSLI